MSRAHQKSKQTIKTVATAGKGASNMPWKDRIHPDEYQILLNTFELFDNDRSGTIDPEEIHKIMEELGDSRKDTLIYTMIDALRYKNKPITFEEFVDLVSPPVGDVKTKEGLRTIFRHLDKDHDDYINYDELKKLARLAGDSINDEEILETLHSIFINYKTTTNEGLHFEEFYTLVSNYYKKH